MKNKRFLWSGAAALFGLSAAAYSGSVEASRAPEPPTCDAYWEGWYFEAGKGCVAGGASGCSNPFPYRSEEECQADNPAPIVTTCDPDLPSDPVSILDAEVDDDTLVMSVRYGGGCEDHLFTLCWDGGFAESHPVQARLSLQHDARGDLCRALITEELEFDLGSLKEAYQEAYRNRSGVIFLDISGHGSRERYVF
jgi:hypothetical protein